MGLLRNRHPRGRGHQVHGFSGGHVVADQDRDLWIGCEVLDSTAGEASGLFWALAWALQIVAETSCTIAPFHFDNISVGSAVFHDWSVSRDTDAISAALALKQMLQVRTAVEAFHVHSHEGQPWNELADVCCAEVRDSNTEYAELCADMPIDQLVVHQIVADGATRAQ